MKTNQQQSSDGAPLGTGEDVTNRPTRGGRKLSLAIVNAVVDAFEEEGIPYSILRNFERLPEDYDGRDLDMVVDSKDLATINRVLGRVLEEDLGFRVLQRVEKVNITSYRIYCVSVTGFDAFTLDLFYFLGFRNNVLVNSSEILGSTRLHAGRYRVPVAELESSISVLHHLLYSARLKKLKYIEKFNASMTRDSFYERFGAVFSDKSTEAIFEALACGMEITGDLQGRLRRELLYYNLKSDLKGWVGRTGRMLARDLYYFLRPDGILIRVADDADSAKLEEVVERLRVFDVRNGCCDSWVKLGFFSRLRLMARFYFKRVRHNIFLVRTPLERNGAGVDDLFSIVTNAFDSKGMEKRRVTEVPAPEGE